jgi:precorrin-8X/cobalt-precorrin-8 methylmutase
LNDLGIKYHCFIADEDVAHEAKERDVTRSSVSMERAAKINGPLILAIGNAPTALIKIRELYDEEKIDPQLVIGVPVGFVNVVPAKELIVESGMPCIVNRGRKGGSNVAAALINALIYTFRAEREALK